MALVNNIILVLNVQFYNTSTVHCTVCSLPKVRSPSITIYPPLLSFTFSHPPFPVVITILLSVSMSLIVRYFDFSESFLAYSLYLFLLFFSEFFLKVSSKLRTHCVKTTDLLWMNLIPLRQMLTLSWANQHLFLFPLNFQVDAEKKTSHEMDTTLSIINSSRFQVSEFILMGLPGIHEWQHWLSLPLALIYTLALGANLLILITIQREPSLHQPMYHFLGILAVVDIGLATTIMPKILAIF